MRVCVTPQYFQGQKLTDRQKADGPKPYGILTLTRSEGGRQAVALGSPSGVDKPPPRVLWNPVLASMYNDTFSISGVERIGSGA